MLPVCHSCFFHPKLTAAPVQIITDTYNNIKEDANQDNAIWHIGSIDDGYQCGPAQ